MGFKQTGLVVLISGVRGDTRRYRQLHLWEQLQLLGYPARLAHITDPGIIAKTSQASLIILHRTPFDHTVEIILSDARKRGVPVLADYDDYLFDPEVVNYIDSPDFADPDRRVLYMEDIIRHRKTILGVDAVLTATSYLAEEISRLGVKCYIHKNAASFELLSLSQTAYQTKRYDSAIVIIGYASGTPTHNRDFAAIAPALAEIIEHYPQMQLRIIGPVMLPDEIQRFNRRVICESLIPWRQLPGTLAELDVNLCPLILNNPFGKSKSEIKYLEAALVGTVSVASPAPAYQEAIMDGKTGFFASTQNDWILTLSKLIDDREMRRRLGDNAREKILSEYTPGSRAAELGLILNEFLPGSSHALPKLDRKQHGQVIVNTTWNRAIESQPSVIRMGLYSMRVNGCLTLLRQIKVFFRRGLAKWIPYQSRTTRG